MACSGHILLGCIDHCLMCSSQKQRQGRFQRAANAHALSQCSARSKHCIMSAMQTGLLDCAGATALPAWGCAVVYTRGLCPSVQVSRVGHQFHQSGNRLHKRHAPTHNTRWHCQQQHMPRSRRAGSFASLPSTRSPGWQRILLMAHSAAHAGLCSAGLPQGSAAVEPGTTGRQACPLHRLGL